MIAPRVLVDASTEPITAAYLKLHARIDSDIEDDAIDVMIGAARRYFEERSGYTIHEKTFEYVLDSWPITNYIELPRATPLIAVSSVEYVDSTGTHTLWSPSYYIPDVYNTPGRLVLGYGLTWPSFTPYPSNPIRIQYRAGIPTTSPITEAPADLKQVIAFLAAHFFNHRETVVIGANTTIQSARVELAADSLIQRFIQWRF